MGHIIWTGLGIILAISAIYSVIKTTKYKKPHHEK